MGKEGTGLAISSITSKNCIFSEFICLRIMKVGTIIAKTLPFIPAEFHKMGATVAKNKLRSWSVG